ncbi:hypothetical protein HQ563_01365, partial [bacterium]|nr:hypothetical protein [bacterium]
MSKKIMILSLAIFLLCQAGLDGSEAPKLASRVPDDAVAAFFVRNVPALAHGKAWMSSLSQAFDGELVIALLDISERKEVPPFVVMGKVNPEKLRWFLDARVKPILRRNLGKVEFESSEGMTAIVVNGSPSAFFAVKGNLLSFSLSKKVVSDSLSRSLPRYESLLTNDLFEKILDRTPADSRSVLFVSIERILETFGHKIPEQERKIWKAIGMLDIAAVGGYDELVDGAQVSSLILITSGKPRGSLALDAQSPAPLRAAKYVPADYSLYARLHFSSFSDVWAEV